ncbi:MAG TPA: DUF2339 domain-containing protein [Xanthomonadales bacterium]|nr:DUF2339 domain-containing protein [Xanthomonadales bacterium]
MPWVFAFIGLVLGIALFIHSPVGGAVVGFAIGWLLGAYARQASELRELERRIASLAFRPAAPEPVAQREPAPARSPAAVAPAAPAPAPKSVEQPARERAVFDIGPAPEDVPAVPEADALPTARERDAALFQAEREAARERAAAAAAAAPPAMAARTSREPPAESPGGLGGLLKRWFTEGNVPVKIGVLVLFFGIASALKYAVEQGFFSFPIEMRLAGIALFAMAGLVFGWRKRHERRAFALSVQGGAVGVLLLTIFAAFAYYHLLPAGLAFGLVVFVVAGAAMMAVLQDAIALAVLAIVGGFLAPVLINTGSGNHVALFSYYAVLNAGILAIAWVRPWRVLNLVGFAFTFGIGLAWGIDAYVPEKFRTTEPFLVLFYLFYLAIPVLYSLRRSAITRTGFVDGTLVFGTPLLAFPLQAAMLREEDMLLAYSALAMAAIYGLLARFLWRRDGQRTLAVSFAALALGFATLAVPIALSARWTACTWALEGAALVWLGLRDRRTWPCVAGVALQLFAAVAYVRAAADGGDADVVHAVANGRFLSGALLALSALFSARLFARDGRWPPAHAVMLGLGCLWWAVTGMREIDAFVPAGDRSEALLMFIAGTIAVAGFARRLLAWEELAFPMIVLFAIVPLGTATMIGDPPMHALEWVAWGSFFVAGAIGLRALREPASAGLALSHIAWLATIAIVLGLELHARTVDAGLGYTAWSRASWIVPLAVITLLAWRRPAIGAWPVAAEWPAHSLGFFVPSSMALVAWWAISLLHDGDATPLAYVPLLNPLEIAQVGVLALLFARWRSRVDEASRKLLTQAFLAAAFVMVSVGALRGVHHLANVPWDPSLLGRSVAQTSLTVVWSVMGVIALILGSRRVSRPTWLVGSAIMAVVLAKLLLVDRTYIGNLSGIVSFVVVGLLFTTVGYFAPTPPRVAATGSAA